MRSVVVGGVGRKGVQHALGNVLFGFLALGVLFLQGGGKARGLRLVLAKQQLQRGGGVVHAARGVQARRQRKRDVLGRQALALQPALANQRGKAGAVCLLQQGQARLYHAAVFAHQGHNIRHSANGRKVAIHGQQLFRVAALQRAHQLKGHPGPGQHAAAALVAGLLRVHHGGGLGQLRGGQVMVRHHHVHAQLFGAAQRPRRPKCRCPP